MVERFTSRRDKRTIVDVLANAAELPLVDGQSDYLISAHMLEHHPDPLLVLHEWRRVLRSGGHLVLILPHCERTYDHGRSLSTLAHLRDVHGRPHDPDNPLNWHEYESFSLTVPHHWTGKPESRTGDGGWNRRWLAERAAIHYHVWTQHEMVEILRALGFRIMAVLDELPERTDSFVVIASKTKGAGCSAIDTGPLRSP